MQAQTLLDTEVISMWIYPERKMIHHVMKAYCFGAEFRGALMIGVAAMEHHGATKWLSDDRANSAVPPDDEEWGMQVWLPRARAAGWRHWAIVQPGKIIGQVNLARRVKQISELGINARMFADPDEAMRWLEAA